MEKNHHHTKKNYLFVRTHFNVNNQLLSSHYFFNENINLMNRILKTFVFFFLVTINQAQNIFNVNNTSSGVTTQYTTLQAAVTAAAAGDIIYLYPSSTTYGSATINKKLTIIGPGYLVAQNPSLEITSYVSNGSVDNLTFAAGSNGTLVTGVDINQININGFANIALTRCRIRLDVNLDNTNNILFEGCFFEYNASNDHKINANNCNSLTIRNNIFINTNQNNGGWYDIVIGANCTTIIENNVFRWYIYVNNSIVRNNIFLQNATNVINVQGSGNSFLNNILVGNQNKSWEYKHCSCARSEYM